MKLKKVSLEMKDEYLSYISEWGEEKIVPFSSTLQDMEYEEWLRKTSEAECRETCPKELVPAYTYFLVDDDDRILGAINIRFELNEYLYNFGGHIGYGIRPSERRKGYGKEMLKLALPIAKEIGLEKVLITCDKLNTASAKTIMSQGGVLENEVEEEGEIVQRYWIKL